MAREKSGKGRSRRWIVVPGVLFLTLFGLSGLYFAVYFQCSEAYLGGRPRIRAFHSKWLMRYYEPAARIESLIDRPTKLVYVAPPANSDW